MAVKQNLIRTDEFARWFRLEAVILATLHHPNFPRITDHFMIGDIGQYLVMDYLPGENLRQRMERIGPFPAEDVIKVGATICNALSYLHSHRPLVLHRNLQPDHVIIAPNGYIFLIGFGLVIIVQSSQAAIVTRIAVPGYSPPEQYGTSRSDQRSDIYALGTTLYAVLTGVIPEDGLACVMENVQLTPIRTRIPSVSHKLAAVIEKALDPYPDDRFQTADAFKQALLGAYSEGEIAASPDFAEEPEKISLAGALATTKKKLFCSSLFKR